MRFITAMFALLLAFAAAAQQPTPPEQQVRFEAMLTELRERSLAAPNDAARFTLRRERARRTQEGNFMQARDWLGTVTRIDVDEHGRATLVVALWQAHGFLVSDGVSNGVRANTKIVPGSPVFDQVSQLRRGDVVRFDASLPCFGGRGGLTDCPADLHPSPSGALEQPLMLADFSRVVPAVARRP